MLGFMVSQRVRLDWVTELNWTDYSMVYIHHNFFIHSSVDGHLGWFHFLAVVNTAARNNGYPCLFQFWCPHDIGLGVGLLGHMVILFLVF